MTKTDAIAAILRLNPTADPMFLSGFPADELSDYLQRLSTTSLSRGLLEFGLSAPSECPGPFQPAMDCLS